MLVNELHEIEINFGGKIWVQFFSTIKFYLSILFNNINVAIKSHWNGRMKKLT